MPTVHKGVHKRIIVCCDGTWQDGIEKKYRWQYSNILKLARAFHREDRRQEGPPIQQIVFYQSGVGSDHNLYSEYIEGATGAGLGEKVQDAYAFIAHNYAQGDEVFLIGFSRGAYTARMVADFIGAIGILDKTDMDHFAEVFLAYQKIGKTDDEDEKKKLQEKIKPFTDPNSRGKQNAEATEGKFMIKCLAVFDTVGSVGLPGELVIGSPKTQLFGFNDLRLGAHVERALQALALNERRKDFSPATWTQTDEGKERGQVLHQCWFTGSHSDVGGGYEFHDLSDLTLTWMVANFEDIIAIDMDYIRSLFHDRHMAPYGEQEPHDSAVGVFTFADSQNRPLPTSTGAPTNQTIHPSALHCKSLRPDLSTCVKNNPDLIWKLKPFEELVQKSWTYDPNQVPKSKEGRETAEEEVKEQRSFVSSIKEQGMKIIGLGRGGSLRRKDTAGGMSTRKVNGSAKRKSLMMDRGAGAGVKIAKEPTGGLTWFTSLLDEVSG